MDPRNVGRDFGQLEAQKLDGPSPAPGSLQPSQR
jgi:hypothetical protein